jgi:hypothetical protein
MTTLGHFVVIQLINNFATIELEGFSALPQNPGRSIYPEPIQSISHLHYVFP